MLSDNSALFFKFDKFLVIVGCAFIINQNNAYFSFFRLFNNLLFLYFFMNT